MNLINRVALVLMIPAILWVKMFNRTLKYYIFRRKLYDESRQKNKKGNGRV